MSFLGIKSFIWTGCIFVIIFFWEHFARISNIVIRPTIGINFITKYCIKGWKWLGEMFAIISSYFKILINLFDYIIDHLGKFIKNIMRRLSVVEAFNSRMVPANDKMTTPKILSA